MRDTESFAVPAQATFGRDGAMFEGLLDFVAQLSLVLWGLVVFTVVIRFVGVGMYRRGATRRALAAALAPPVLTPAGPEAPADTRTERSPAGLIEVMTADAAFRKGPQPAEVPATVATPLQVHRRIFRSRRRQMPALASSTEG
ncbi:hypothetical protein ACP3TD_15105 [Pseudarthrobacter sp. 1G09]|uniref:hypothetical protein n=1 Tax=Pseudarthrobacter sp. 1G09 TaxID=3416178 RepID=UPI003CEE42CA